MELLVRLTHPGPSDRDDPSRICGYLYTQAGSNGAIKLLLSEAVVGFLEVHAATSDTPPCLTTRVGTLSGRIGMFKSSTRGSCDSKVSHLLSRSVPSFRRTPYLTVP